MQLTCKLRARGALEKAGHQEQKVHATGMSWQSHLQNKPDAEVETQQLTSTQRPAQGARSGLEMPGPCWAALVGNEDLPVR